MRIVREFQVCACCAVFLENDERCFCGDHPSPLMSRIDASVVYSHEGDDMIRFGECDGCGLNENMDSQLWAGHVLAELG